MKIKSFIKNASLALRPRPLPIEKPTVLQFPINDICNSRCQMCRIWENKQSEDINLDQLRRGLDNPLYSEVVSIGVNGGEPTLREDLPKIVEVLFQSLPKLKNISLITNGYKYNQVIERVDAVGKVVNKYKGYFDLMLSLDGYKEVHDLVRGHKNYFNKAIHVIDYAESSKYVNNFRVGCTVIKENIYGLADLLDYCIKRNVYIKYRLGIPHQRLYTNNLSDPYNLTFNEKYELVEFLENLCIYYEKGDAQLYFYKSLIGQIMHGKNRVSGCDWQHRGITITSKGELLYCAVKSDVLLDDISNGDSEYAYFNNRDHQLDIISGDCDSCNHDYVGVPPRGEYAKRLMRRVLRVFFKNSISVFKPLKFLLNFKREYQFNSRLKKYEAYRNTNSEVVLSEHNKKILICGWYGTETLGDKAILAGIINVFNEKYGDKIDVYLASINPYVSEITKSQMPELANITILTVEESISISRSMDLVVFGGGPIMAINNIAEMEVIFKEAKENGVETLIAGCGVGPLGANYHNDSICRLLTLSDKRIFRDEQSLHLCQKLGVNTDHDVVAEDPAFTWLNGLIERNTQSEIIGTSRKILLLGLRDFPYQEYAKHVEIGEAIKIKEQYEYLIVNVLKRMCDTNEDLIIKPLPMCTNHFGSDDRWFYRRLFRNEDKLESSIDYSLLYQEMEPEKYVVEFKSSTVLLAMRFHSLVFGLSTGIPSVALDYTLGKGKVDSLANKYSVPVLRLDQLNEDELFNMLTSALNKNQVKTTVKTEYQNAVNSILND